MMPLLCQRSTTRTQTWVENCSTRCYWIFLALLGLCLVFPLHALSFSCASLYSSSRLSEWARVSAVRPQLLENLPPWKRRDRWASKGFWRGPRGEAFRFRDATSLAEVDVPRFFNVLVSVTVFSSRGKVIEMERGLLLEKSEDGITILVREEGNLEGRKRELKLSADEKILVREMPNELLHFGLREQSIDTGEENVYDFTGQMAVIHVGGKSFAGTIVSHESSSKVELRVVDHNGTRSEDRARITVELGNALIDPLNLDTQVYEYGSNSFLGQVVRVFGGRNGYTERSDWLKKTEADVVVVEEGQGRIVVEYANGRREVFDVDQMQSEHGEGTYSISIKPIGYFVLEHIPKYGSEGSES